MATFREWPVVCPNHPEVVKKVWAWDSDPLPACETCGAAMQDAAVRGNKAPAVIGDFCDVTVHHGICNPDGTPRRYLSKSEMRQAAKALGWTNVVEHVPTPGSDKSPHTSKWV